MEVKKSIYRLSCTVLLTAIAGALFFPRWHEFAFHHNQTGHLMGLGNLGMALLIYLGMYLVIGRWMGAFRIGSDRRATLLASQVLTLLTVDTLEIFVSMAITGQYRFFNKFLLLYSILFLLQSVILCLAMEPMISIFRKVFPPLQILEIHGDIENVVAEKFNGIPNKYLVAKQIRYQVGIDAITKEIPQFDAVLINDLPAQEENHILKACFDADKRVYFVPKISDIIVKSSENVNRFDTPIYLCRNIGIRQWQMAVKRFFDIALSILGLIFLSPIFLITAIAIKLEDQGPILYRQERCTLGGKHFNILKFRSMIVDAEKDGRSHPAGEDDPRITKVGRFIRACRVDELPQLINILKGEMSVVGPRPERIEHVEKYTEDIPEFSFRNKIKGGLTGAAQVYGKYNTTALDKLKMDLMYITNYSLLLDLQILFETAKILFQKESTEGFTDDRVKEMHDIGREGEHT